MTKAAIKLIHHLLVDDFGVDLETYNLLLELLPPQGQDALAKMVQGQDGMYFLSENSITLQEFETKLYLTSE